MLRSPKNKRSLFNFFSILIMLLLFRTIINVIPFTNAMFVSSAPVEGKTENSVVSVSYSITDEIGNPITQESIGLNTWFIVTVTNSGNVDCDYECTNYGTEDNDITQNLGLSISNMRTSSTEVTDYVFMSNNLLMDRPLMFKNKRLKPGETDTWKVKYSTARLDNPNFQASTPTISRHAQLGMKVYAVKSSP